MPSSFSPGISVEYAGARWRVLRVVSAEAILLGSETGEEVSADPLKIRLPDSPPATGPSPGLFDELRHGEADWAEAQRRRDLLQALASQPGRTADVTAAAEALGLTPRRVWALLRQARMAGDEIAQFLPARHGVRKKRLSNAVEAIIRQAIDQHYTQRTRPSLNSLVGESRDAARQLAFDRRPPRQSRRASAHVIRSG